MAAAAQGRNLSGFLAVLAAVLAILAVKIDGAATGGMRAFLNSHGVLLRRL